MIMGKLKTRSLVIVESPTKARTISRFLPENFEVEASMGHVRDLPASAAEIPTAVKKETWSRLGVNIGNNFQPIYVVSNGKKSVVTNLKAALKKADELYIATDEDREGESIGWHLLELLKPKIPVRRMVFHEITEKAILQALENTRAINQDLVEAQETRRVLDRLVGYTISPLLWKKIAPRLSAGRVQSVAVRLMVLREKERLKFVPAAYWNLKANLGKAQTTFEATLTHLGDTRLVTGRDFDPDTGLLKSHLKAGNDVLLLKEQKASTIAEAASRNRWSVKEIDERISSRSPSPPFITSTLQQEASRKLNLSARNTMRVAQGLYEKGLITYMRTDSTLLSQEALESARTAVKDLYGDEFLSPSPRQFANKSRNAQEAHEAIRPAGNAMKTKDRLGLSGSEGALYDLIWKRTVATQMADARLKFVTARIEVLGEGEVALFRATGRTTLFPGFFRAYVEGSDDPEAVLEDREQPLPELFAGDELACNGVGVVGHETKPPARYTEASLVKLLELEGIGRPSTYASIIETVMQRGSARKSGSQLGPTFTAFATNSLHEDQFSHLVDTEFTATMESALDDIASGKLNSTPYLKSFFLGEDGIEARVEEGLTTIDARSISTIQAEKWGPYRVRVGRYGPYVEGSINNEIVTASLPNDLSPADLTQESIEKLLRNGQDGDEAIGEDPNTGLPITLRSGPYGPYLELGEKDTKKKPKRVSLPPGLSRQDVTESLAVELINLPKDIGLHPKSGVPIEIGIGRYGPFVRHGKVYASLPKGDNLFETSLDRAIALITKKENRNKPLRILGDHPDSGEPVQVLDGRYGPYVKHASTNATLPKGITPETVTFEQGLTLLAEKEAKKPTPRGSRAAAKKKRPKASKPKNSRPKATWDDLSQHLAELDKNVADVVTRIEGLNGSAAIDLKAVATATRLTEEEVAAMHKRGMFKLRMAHGKARAQSEKRP